MAGEDRSLAAVFQDIVRNIQEIIRSEVRLAKTEIREEAVKAKGAVVLLGAGAVTGLYALLFLLCVIVCALALIMPYWSAALIVGAVLAVIAAFLLKAGMARFHQITPTPERTVETIKENVAWAKQQTK